ncbi:MAG: SpoIIE family protein phosphatase [Microscillaceae bacterium]|jgi:serine phosphatase RsbU (regulator of sigma subunit)|nr:SpoIIE family protein phosphatase [Microscillaceae bacterium]
MNKLSFYLIFSILFFPFHHVFAQNNVIVIDKQISQLNLSKNQALEVYPDKTGTATFALISQVDFQKQFVALSSVADIYNPEIKSYWFKFQLKNLSQESDFAIDMQMWEYSAVYWRDSTSKIHKYENGVLTPFAQRPIRFWDRMIYLPLQLPHNQSGTFYIHCYSKSNQLKRLARVFNFFDKMILKKYNEAAENYRISNFFFSFYAGVVLIMAVYMFIFYGFVRDVTYLYFCLFLLHQWLYTMVDSGLAVAFIYPNYPQIEYPIISYSLIFVFVFLLLFVRSYLQLWHYLPTYNRIFWGLAAILAGFYVVITTTQISLSMYVLLVEMLGIVFIFIANILSIRKGYKPAIYLLLADVFYLSGVLATIVIGTQLSHISEKIPILNLFLYVGSILQITLFATGLAYRYNAMRREIETQTLENERIVKEQNQMLEQKVKERTSELNEANEELRTIEEELRQNMEELATGKEALEQAYKIIEEKNLIFTHSIRSAEKIQHAILPSEAELKTYFADHFIIYEPKDVVSGDFYWLAHQADKTFVACVDCTGHGVPGAFMSLIGNALLNEIVKEKKIYEAHKILEYLHLEVNKALRQQTGNSIEGMDMVMCVLEKWEDQSYSLQYSGAKNPIFYSSEGKIQTIFGDRIDIGGYQKGLFRTFTPHTVRLAAQDTLYLFTDGYIDAPNPKRRRIGIKQFEGVLSNIQNLPLAQQKQTLEKVLQDHTQDTLQRDDITVLGLKLR